MTDYWTCHPTTGGIMVHATGTRPGLWNLPTGSDGGGMTLEPIATVYEQEIGG